MIRRSGLIQFKGKDATIIGDDVKPGDLAPEFVVQTQNWEPFQGLAQTAGKVRIIAAVPSLDTEVCDRETRRFNQEAASLSEDIVILVISMDLPFAQKRWCGAAGIDRVIVLSDHMQADFGEKYGCLIEEARLLRRAVFVVDRNDRIVYTEYLPALGLEPNYQAVLQAAQSALVG
ncbi:MAG: thiol peroxidase [Anaerolineales bacterium]|nr:thiol peroxidase [Anaerolineales bacterium]MCX7608031.1 thiol peroxidase [Anaerolineales bacterium]MDW8227503.1 thiol peroxidase [Anaerolineales bacterium]